MAWPSGQRSSRATVGRSPSGSRGRPTPGTGARLGVDHTVFAPLVGELRDEFTIFAMDRRGFGASRDDPGYSAEREFSDVSAVVDAVAARTGEPVVLFGSSWGASYALGAAPDLPSLRALVLYEPSLGLRYPPGSIDRMEERVAAGDNEGAIVEMATQIAGLTEDGDRRTAGGTELA